MDGRGAGGPGQPGPGQPGLGQQGEQAPPFTELTTDVAGRSRPDVPAKPGAPASPDLYGEHTTDIAGRGQTAPDKPYVPAPALPNCILS